MMVIAPLAHWTLQISNALGLMSYVTTNVLVLRVLACASAIFTIIWAVVVVNISVDYVLWYLLYLLINVYQAAVLLYKMRPVEFDSQEHEDIYAKFFAPPLTAMNRHEFKELYKCGFLRNLKYGYSYADHGTMVYNLSILLKGKIDVIHLQVNDDGRRSEVHVNELLPLEFIESPQWLTRRNANDDQSFIGTLRAAENSRYLMWPLENLDSLIEKQPHFRAYIDAVIGVDVAHKMLNMETKVHEKSSSSRSVSFSNNSSHHSPSPYHSQPHPEHHETQSIFDWSVHKPIKPPLTTGTRALSSSSTDNASEDTPIVASLKPSRSYSDVLVLNPAVTAQFSPPPAPHYEVHAPVHSLFSGSVHGVPHEPAPGAIEHVHTHHHSAAPFPVHVSAVQSQPHAPHSTLQSIFSGSVHTHDASTDHVSDAAPFPQRRGSNGENPQRRGSSGADPQRRGSAGEALRRSSGTMSPPAQPVFQTLPPSAPLPSAFGSYHNPPPPVSRRRHPSSPPPIQHHNSSVPYQYHSIANDDTVAEGSRLIGIGLSNSVHKTQRRNSTEHDHDAALRAQGYETASDDDELE